MVVGILFGVAALASGSAVRADVGLPIGIKMPVDTPPAVAGQEYNGKFLVHVFKAGTLDHFQLGGEGWRVVTFTPPAGPALVQPSVIEIPFRAIPTDVNKRIALTLTYNGQTVHRAYDVGPSVLERGTKPYRLRRLERHELREAGAATEALDDDAGQSPSGQVVAGSRSIRVTGRIVYTRPCRDLRDPNTGDDPDGDCDDPWDIPARIVGVDGIDVRLLDNDTVGSEEMWSGYTDPDGYFDTQEFTWEGSDFDPDPDLVIWAETEVDGLVDVTDDSVGEYTYWFDTPEVGDFTGSYYNFGTLTPSDSSLFPALHIFTSIVRADRYVRDVALHDLGEVQVMWPDDSQVGGAWYEDNWDPPEIHISTERQWREATHTHEYGHHYMQMVYSFDFPDADYCNDGTAYCDDASGVPGCYPADIERCGHCKWCQETDHDAFGEGFPNWLADVVTRDYPERYTFDDGTEFAALYGSSEEGIETCCQDSQLHNPFLTEGFVGALLRDIEDDTQDDHDNDEIIDTLCVGPGPIFDVVDTFEPVVVSDFINGFVALYPSYADELYPTAFNVSPQFVSGFPADTEPPSPVAYVSSPSHPLLTGGGLPCITVEWLPADDDRGACFYAYEWAPTAAGAEPSETPHVVTTNGCYLQADERRGLGQWWFSIKAQDCPDESGNPGSWGPTRTFGPFEVIDCNASGYNDLCDIRCCDAGCNAGPDDCVIAENSCPSGSCETSEDCNGNYVPDECDLANGTSEDCNRNAIPDECENTFHWVGTSGSWHSDINWLEGELPPNDSSVCIRVSGDQTVTYSDGSLQIASLACSENLSVASDSYPWADLTLHEASWVDGDLGLSVDNTVLCVDDRLDIGGLFEWTGSNISYAAKLGGLGVTYAYGGVHIVDVVRLDGHLVLDGNSTSITTGQIYFLGGSSVFEISPGSTYDHQGSDYALRGWSGDTFDNNGTFIASVDTGTHGINVFTDNSGLIHVQNGTLSLQGGSSSTGDFFGAPGTTLEFLYGGHEFLPGSSIVADNVTFTGSNTVSGTYDVTTSTTHTEHSLTFASEANIISYGSAFYISSGTVNFDAIVGGNITFDTLSVGGTGYGTANFNSGDPVQVTNLVIGPGTIQGPSTVSVSTHLTWGGSSGSASFKGPGVVYVDGDMTIEATSTNYLQNCVLNNAGHTTFLGRLSLSSSAVFNNLASGVMDIRHDGDVFPLDASSSFDNAGTLVKSAGVGTSTIAVDFSNSGIVEVQSGVLEFRGYTLGQQTQTAGRTVLNGGDLAFTNGEPYDMQGGLLAGVGTITGNVANAGGRVEPGLSVGRLDLDGAYTQGPAGSLAVELGGSLQGQYDVLVCTGNVSLAGDLDVVLINGFEPNHGDTFQIIQGGPVTGEFQHVGVTSLPPNMELVVHYAPTTVTLIAPPVAGDCDEDYVVGMGDHSAFVPCMAGPAGGLGQDCDCADIDGDGHVDLRDHAALQVNFIGPLP